VLGQLRSAFLCIYRHHRVVTDGLAQPVGLCSVWIWVVGLPRLSRKKPPEMKETRNLAWFIFCAFGGASVSYVWRWCVVCCASFFSIVFLIIVYDESTAQKHVCEESFWKDAYKKLVSSMKVEKHHMYWNSRKLDVLKAIDMGGSTVWFTLTLKNKDEIKEHGKIITVNTVRPCIIKMERVLTLLIDSIQHCVPTSPAVKQHRL